ncbi:hypothetical protein ABT352_13270 [Streptosporangium sp. NPDC000563]|uniref:hypothetical protein n=1 Tax=Streptosporangium sp. NPDC000563 TaxID=3154366 RepID=UPI00331CB7B4
MVVFSAKPRFTREPGSTRDRRADSSESSPSTLISCQRKTEIRDANPARGPKFVYHFLKTFADSPANLASFDQAMGGFSQKLIADTSEKTRRTGDVDHRDRVFTALGNVRGFELAAIEKVRGDLDAIEEQKKDTFNFFFRDATIGVASMHIGSGAAWAYAWLRYALSTCLSGYGAFFENDEPRMDRADAAERVTALNSVMCDLSISPASAAVGPLPPHPDTTSTIIRQTKTPRHAKRVTHSSKAGPGAVDPIMSNSPPDVSASEEGI